MKIEAEYEKLNDLSEIDIIPIIITVSLVINFIFNSHSGVFVPTMKNGLIIVSNMKNGQIRYKP